MTQEGLWRHFFKKRGSREFVKFVNNVPHFLLYSIEGARW